MPGSTAVPIQTASLVASLTPTDQVASSPSFGVRTSASASVGASRPAGRCRVEDRRRAGQPPEAERLVRRTRPDLVADQHDIVRREREPLERIADMDRRHHGVRAACHRDRVLAGFVDGDQRDAGRMPSSAAQPGTVDPFALERRAGLLAERVVPDRTHEEGRHAEPSRRDRLVAALAAVMCDRTARR